MNFSELPPSKQWAALKYRGEKLAEVWIKPEGEPFGITFRIPQKSFEIPSLNQQLTPANLLKAVNVSIEELQSWSCGDVEYAGMDGANPELRTPLVPPLKEVPYLEICVRLKTPARADTEAGVESCEGEISLETWQDLESRWTAILGMEAAMESLRASMDSVRSEMEAALKRTLATEEKRHALRNDVVLWNKAKSRLHHAIPKVREFIHRTIWMMGAPERKKLEQLYKNHIEPRIPFPDMRKVLDQLERMQKDRQVLSAQGTKVFQECKTIMAEVQGALRALQNNANANAHRMKGGTGSKGKFF